MDPKCKTEVSSGHADVSENSEISEEPGTGSSAEKGNLKITKTTKPTDTTNDAGTREDFRPVAVDDSGDVSMSDVNVTKDTDPDCICSICDFVAKTPTALKIHSKRKHSRRGAVSRLDSTSGKKTETIAVGNTHKQPATERSDGGKDAEHVLKNPQLPADQDASTNPDQKTGSEATGSADQACSTAGGSGSPTQIFLESASLDVDEEKEQSRTRKRGQKARTLHVCTHCGHEFRDKPSLETHTKRRHTKEMNYFCEFCSYACVARCDYEKHCASNKHKRRSAESGGPPGRNKVEEQQGTCGGAQVTPAGPAARPVGGRARFQCSSCAFRARTSALLESHVKTKHPAEHRFHCKACYYYTTTAEGMETHLSGETHQRVAKEKNMGPLFDECVEKVLVILSENITKMVDVAKADGTVPVETDEEAEEAVEAVLAEAAEDDEDGCPPKRKRGRPKLTSVTTCSHCGLVASNATNLSVHIRRRHSREYSFACRLCSYYCVTKGDMDRHCVTKKHLKRCKATGNPETAVQLLGVESTGQATEEETAEAGSPSEEGGTTGESDAPGGSSSKNRDRLEGQEDAAPGSRSAKRSKYDSVNSCAHCDFVAHSIPSLELHVKRKHTKDFEFACLACNYYAVTRREMSRHASTEKHKQMSQTHRERQGRNVGKGSGERMDVDNGEEADDGSVALTVQPAETEMDINSSVQDKRDAAEDLPDQVAVGSVAEDGETKGPDVPVSEPPGKDDSVCESEPEDDDSDGDEDSTEGKVHKGDKQLFRAVPFDSCIVPVRNLPGGERPKQDIFEPVEGDATDSGVRGVLSPAKAKKARVAAGPVSTPRIKCEDCGFLADGVSGLNVHISMKHPSKDKHFHCLLCGKSFYTESNLHQHLTSVGHLRNEQASIEVLPEGGATFKCVKCNEPFEFEQDLFVHIKEKHEELLREVNKYVLEDTEQINREREENQGSVCKYCGKVCKSSNSMAFLAHVRTHTGSKPFRCKICNFATAQLGDARNHVKRHLGMREYKCHICGWAFVMKKHLSTHLLGKHGLGRPKERKYECELCDRSFSEKWALNNHMKLHTGDKPYKCAWPNCHYAFLTFSAMKDHYRTHTGEKSFLCDLCGFAGGTRHALTKHRRQHTGERPFKCHLCNFASTTQSHLTRHKRVHTGEKPYRCPWCDYRSNCAENIRKHILHTGKHEGVKMYNCPKCDYATNAPMDFRNHLKEMHPDIENPDLAYLHAGIVSKSFECRLKGQGASFVEAEAAFSPDEAAPSPAQPLRGAGSSADGLGQEAVQQVIIIQGYGGGEVGIEQALEESAAATLQTLAMGGQVAEVLHITEDGQLIASGHEAASTAAHLAATGQIQLPPGSAQYVLVESSGDASGILSGQEGEEQVAAATAAGTAMTEEGHVVVPESSTALDALLCAVSELGQQGGVDQAQIIATTLGKEEGEEQGEVQMYREVVEGDEMEGQVGVVAQMVGHASDDTPDEMVHEVLQFAASQLMMKEGLTQVIVNDEGTHYIVTELDDSTLQVEGAVYAQSEEAEQGQAEVLETQAGERVVVYAEEASQSFQQEG
uniref:C2H2-type domain-containing protein n=1 Tax=Denticeps clupeoides TaxID=299321 RepID=A0AAY3ZYG0_9TELE